MNIGIPILNTRRVHDRIIFKMVIPMEISLYTNEVQKAVLTQYEEYRVCWYDG